MIGCWMGMWTPRAIVRHTLRDGTLRDYRNVRTHHIVYIYEDHTVALIGRDARRRQRLVELKTGGTHGGLNLLAHYFREFPTVNLAKTLQVR